MMTARPDPVDRVYWPAVWIVSAVQLACTLLVVIGFAAIVNLMLRASPGEVAWAIRLAMWLLLVELLVVFYLRRYSMAIDEDSDVLARMVIRESVEGAWAIVLYCIPQFIKRILIVLGVALLLRMAFVHPVWVAMTGLVPTVFQWMRRVYFRSAIWPDWPRVIRGTHIGTFREAQYRAIQLWDWVAEQVRRAPGYNAAAHEPLRLPTLPFGGVELVPPAFDPHFLVLGAPNSGKTLSIRMLLRSALVDMDGRLQARAMIYDAKREYLPALTGMGIPMEQITVFNPADNRSTVWHIAMDIRNLDDCQNLAAILIPQRKEEHKNTFFTNSAQSLLTAVMFSLHSRSPGSWRLLDVIKAFESPKNLKALLYLHPFGRNTYKRLFTKAQETVGGIISTLQTDFIAKYQTIANAWARSNDMISITEWIQSNRVLVLGWDSNNLAIKYINQAMFERASALLCALDNVPRGDNESWIVLDEVRMLGTVPMLPELMSIGRTKGVRVVLAPQDVEGLEVVWGQTEAAEMLGLCGNVATFRLTSSRSAKWASDMFGSYEGWESDYNDGTSVSTGRGGVSEGTSKGRSRKIQKREAIMPSQFTEIRPASIEGGVWGFFRAPLMGAWRGRYLPNFIDTHLTDLDPNVPAFEARPPTDVDPLPPQMRNDLRPPEDWFTDDDDAPPRDGSGGSGGTDGPGTGPKPPQSPKPPPSSGPPKSKDRGLGPMGDDEDPPPPLPPDIRSPKHPPEGDPRLP